VSWFVHYRQPKRAARLELRGRGRAARLNRNWLGNASSPGGIITPEGYMLTEGLAQKLAPMKDGDVLDGVAVLNWHDRNLPWTRRVYTCLGADKVKKADGTSLEARRFQYWQEGSPEHKIDLWVDDKGFPVAKRIGFLKLDFVPCTKEVAGDESKELPFAEAAKRWHLKGEDWIYRRLHTALERADTEAGKAENEDEAEAEAGAKGTKEDDGGIAPASTFPESLLIDVGF